MLRVLWRLTRGYRFSPWRSPYLRWRMETYWGCHAEQIGLGEFWRFAWQRRAGLWRYLRWAAREGTKRRGPETEAGTEDLRIRMQIRGSRRFHGG
jgi:hypothetical protein